MSFGLILCCLSFTSFATSPPDPNRGLEMAQALILKKQRQPACAKLQEIISSLPPSAKPMRAKMVAALNQFSKMFFTDQGQKAFEAGQSLMFENPDLAMGQYRDVLGSGRKSNGTHEHGQDLPYETGLRWRARGAGKGAPGKSFGRGTSAARDTRFNCQQHYEMIHDKVKALPAMDKWEEQYLQFLLAQDYLQSKSVKKALEVLTHLAEDQPQFPETYFYLSRAGTELNRDTDAWLHKYVSLCKALSGKERRRFSLEPRLCMNLKEVEDDLVKKNTDS